MYGQGRYTYSRRHHFGPRLIDRDERSVGGGDGICLPQPDDTGLDRARKEISVVCIRNCLNESMLPVLEVLYDLARREGVDGGRSVGGVLEVAKCDSDGQLDFRPVCGRAADGDGFRNVLACKNESAKNS
jgi:hypothetical protein